jgi:NAD(P)H dehydrogenase (quinone)
MTIAASAVRENATDRSCEPVRRRGGGDVMARIVIIGGGPAGYEAALVAAQHDAEVTLVEAEGAGGACVLSDCVPSKTFIASSDVVTAFRHGGDLGVRMTTPTDSADATLHTAATLVGLDPAVVHARVKRLALAQSADIAAKLVKAGIDLVRGRARLGDEVPGHLHRVVIEPVDGAPYAVNASHVLIATGAIPRILPDAAPDGVRILTWRDVYDLPALPEHLVVVGSGVTGAEFASAYLAAGVQVTLVSSRARVMPHEDPDAAAVIEDVFRARGMTVLSHARAAAARSTGDAAVVELTDGRSVTASHVLMAVGSRPNTAGLGLAEYGIEMAQGGYVTVDRVSRTNLPGVYAAGDCTGVLPLASVAAMQGRIAMWHALGEAVTPLRLKTVAANVFTDPELASVGVSQSDMDSGRVPARSVTLPLSGNARAKMADMHDGFVKLFCRPASGLIIGGVVVAPKASELILPISLAVENHLTVSQLAHTTTIYPSLSGSVAEAARQLMQHEFE